MSRDFLIEFSDLHNAQVAEKTLKNIKTEEGITIFNDIDNRGLSLFVTLTYPKEINKNLLIINDNIKINFFESVNFVAIKNGIHSETGFLFVSDPIKKFLSKGEINVKDIHNFILNYFNN